MGNYLCKGQPFLIPGLNNKSPIGRLNHYCKLYLLFSSLLCFLDRRLSLQDSHVFYKTGLFSYKTAMFLQDIHGFFQNNYVFFTRQSFFFTRQLFFYKTIMFFYKTAFYKTVMSFTRLPCFLHDSHFLIQRHLLNH